MEDVNKEYIEEWSQAEFFNQPIKKSKLVNKKRKRSLDGELNQTKEAVSTIEVTDAYNLTEEDKLKCKYSI